MLLARDHRTSSRRILSVLSSGGETKRKRTKHELSWLTAISDAGSTPAASTICKGNKIMSLYCGKILELEFVPILYEC